jgi:hypothetical protein
MSNEAGVRIASPWTRRIEEFPMLRSTAAVLALAAALVAQSTAVYPADYVNVPEGPLNAPNLPLANGTGRAMVVYEQWDLPIPVGSAITHLGFREDGTLTTMDTGRTLQLEVRMGYTANGTTNMSSTLDNNYAGAPVTVFPSAAFQLPNLREVANPLPNGQFFIPLVTPFVYTPGANNLVVEYRIFGNSGGGTSFNYRLDRADFYSPTATGPAGCPSSGGGVPSLTLQPVRCGSAFGANVTTAPGSSFSVLLLAVGTQLLPPFSLQPFLPGIASACQGQIPVAGMLSLTTVSSASGAASWSFTIPNVRVPWNDTYVSCQCAFFDFFAPGGLVVSNGAQVQIGIQTQSTILWGAGPPTTVTTGSPTLRYCPVAFFRYQ